MPAPPRLASRRPNPDRAAALHSKPRSVERVIHLSFLVMAFEAIVILGVTFRGSDPFHPVMHPLSVTVVDTRSRRTPHAVTVYAQNRSRGGGRRVRRLLHAAFLPSGQINQTGTQGGSGIWNFRPGSRQNRPETTAGHQTQHGQEPVVTARRAETRRAVRSGTPGNHASPTEVLDVRELRIASDASLPPVADPFRRTRGSDRIRPHALSSISARSLVLARYLDQWRRRIEQVGNRLLAQQGAPADFRGHLLLAVSLRADGSVANVHFMRASRNPNLNRLALETLDQAEPFPPLPPHRHQHTLHFVYEWVFSRDTLRTGTP